MILDNSNFLNLFFLLFSGLILLIVYYLEFFVGVEPCKLCIYQRFPYFIVILLASSSLLIKNLKIKKLTFIFYILIFFISLIMSLYHFGIEKNLWNALTGCEATIKSFGNSNNLKEYLLNKNYVSCNNVSFKFLGISLAGYNVIISFILLVISTIGLRKIIN